MNENANAIVIDLNVRDRYTPPNPTPKINHPNTKLYIYIKNPIMLTTNQPPHIKINNNILYLIPNIFIWSFISYFFGLLLFSMYVMCFLRICKIYNG